MSLQLGEIDSKYEILEKLGEGGMGAVFKVRHVLLDEIRVIKAILPVHQGDRGLQQRFRREAQAATRLRHPNIAQVHDLMIDDEGTTHIVMEFIKGRTLEQALTEFGSPDLDTAVEIASQSLEAVSYLHGKGYLHRDISPDNLMLTRSFDGKILVKLIDLGLAKRHVGSVGLTAPGVFMGKVRYAAPEHFVEPDREFDPRSDIYSFGVVLYELLTGKCPIRGDSVAQIIASHLHHPVPDFDETDLGSQVPRELREITLQALAKEPSDRIANAELLLETLGSYREPSEKSLYLKDLLANISKARPSAESSTGAGGSADTGGSAGSETSVDVEGAAESLGAESEMSPSGISPVEGVDLTVPFGESRAFVLSQEGAETRDSQEVDDSVDEHTGITVLGKRGLESELANLADPETPVADIPSAEVDLEAEAAEEPTEKRKISRTLIGAGVMAAAVLFGLLVGVRFMKPDQPTPAIATGSLRLDAVPWAEVREIKTVDGKSEPLNERVFTPIVLSLAPGNYEISLTHPDFAEPRSMEVEIVSSRPVNRRVEFEPQAVESYFAAVGLTASLQAAGL